MTPNKSLKLLSIALGIGLTFLITKGNGLTPGEMPPNIQEGPRYPPDNDTDPANEMNFPSLKLNHDNENDRKRSVSVDEPTLIPFINTLNLYGTRRYIIRNLNANRANFLLYPYNFSYNGDSQVFDWDFTGDEEENSTVKFNSGSFVSTMGYEDLPDSNSSDYFYWLNTTQMKINKAKPVYDVNVAVLQVQVNRVSGSIDLTYESDSFCNMFYSWGGGKYTRCFASLKEYDEYVAERPTESGKPTFSYVTPDDFNTGRIFTNVTLKPRFGILYIPDIIRGEEKTIMNLFTEEGKANFVKYVRTHGGMVTSSGKGVFLLQDLGFIPADTFSKRYTLKTDTSANGWVYTDGCSMDDVATTSGATSEEDEYVKRTLCFSPPDPWDSSPATTLLSAPMFEKEEIGSGATVAGMRPIVWYRTNVNWRRILKHDEETGLDYDLAYESTPRSYPMMLHKRDGKGQVVVVLGNPSFSFATAQWMYNPFFLAGSRPLALDNEVIGGMNGTIPALERVALTVKLSLTNYFTDDITNDIAINVYLRNGTKVRETGSKKCTESTEVTLAELPASGLTTEKKFVCTLQGGIPKLSKKEWTFTVEITDPLVTQTKDDVVLLWPYVKYTDKIRGSEHTLSYAVTIGAASAGYLRADMNIDPSSAYPHHSKGTYIDNVMNCENKEDTPALDVVHHSIAPLITPVIDMVDQIHLANYMEFDKDYYEQATNNLQRHTYPYKAGTGENRDFDILDWDLLYNRSDSLAANWDEAAKITKVHRNEYPGIGPTKGISIGSIMNANYQTTNDNPQFVLKQSNFADADTYYEHATQRMMAFLDVNDPNAARTYHRGNVPASDAQKTHSDRAKRRVLFWRHDIFFWTKYPLPLGLTDYNTVISVDRYEKNLECKDGNNKATVPGAFGNDVGGLIPREWTNALLQLNCNVTVLNEKTVESATNGQIKLIKYIVPVEKSDGEEAEDFIGFDSNGNLKGYEDLVQFVKILRAKVDVSPEVSRLGGILEIKFATAPWSEGLAAAIAAGRVTVAADQISVYEIFTKTDPNTLYIRFKRGSMPNEAYGQASHLQIVLDTPTGTTAQSLSATMNVYELLYDLGNPKDNFEDWSQRTVTGQGIVFERMGGFRMPALKMTFRTTNEAANDPSKSFFGSYELREPFVRYGIYEQELLQHRSIHGSAEFHPINDPCLVTKTSGFSAVTHIGTSSVPFCEYVATGTSLLIPAAPETGRIEWTDVWGRRWVQNVRSTIFEYPPIPPPLRNFVMTTTYELIHGYQRFLRWRSKDTVDVRVQMKILNNYPKWFEITNCKANEIIQKCGDSKKDCDVARVFDVDLERVAQITSESDLNSKDLWVTQGHTANYGKCFSNPEVYLSGNKFSEEQRKQVQDVVLCAQMVGTGEECQCLPEGLSTVSHRPSTVASNVTWNFAQQVKEYWPENYIKDNMWDLTHYDYDDNWYDKAYKYHMDNNLPQLGSGWSRPQNTIVFPLYKGLGYSMTYDKTHTNQRFYGKAGWWSDNLQNRDHTLVAGQTWSNDISVGKESLIPEQDWVDITTLRGGDEMDKSVEAALKNVYTCRFNRRRVRVDPKNTRGFHLKNVFENNIVPIPHDFDTQMEFNYDCSDGVRYSPDNISQFDNFVGTETARDWLYFAANLRGGALENINVLATLAPLSTSSVRFEGTAKVQDGGRFTYWNPANSINSYLVVDNPVSTVLAVRNDIEIKHELIPTYATTFDAVLFHHITIADPEEVGREWELDTYNNQYGFGDFSVAVFVGDSGTSCKLQPGGSRARVKFTFNNNAGFDIDLLGNAIEAVELESKPIRADDLLKGVVSAIRKPTKYNFLNITIPPEIKDYVTITPSEDVVGVAGLFFDFDSINVASIRDGWKADYYLDLKISRDFPDHLRGQTFELPVSLVPEYFSTLPGDSKRDPVGKWVHNYEVEVPPILFGVPYSSSAGADLAGKVFYTSGYATNVSFRMQVDAAFSLGEAYLLPNGDADVDPFRKCLGGSTDFSKPQTLGEFKCLDRVWDELKTRAPLINYTLLRGTRDPSTNSSEDHYVDFAEGFRTLIPSLPTRVPDVPGRPHIPDVAGYHILFRTDAPQLKSGWPLATRERTVRYIDDFDITDAVHDWAWLNVHAKGAFLTLDWSVKLISESGENVVLDGFQPENEGIADVTITVTNTGDYYAYGVNFTLELENGITAAIPGIESIPPESVLPLHENCSAGINEAGSVTLSCSVAATLVPNSPHAFVFRIAFGPDPREGASDKAPTPLNLRVFASRVKGSLDLTATRGEKTVTQEIPGPFGIKYTDKSKHIAMLSGKDKKGTEVTLEVSHLIDNARVYTFKAKLPKSKVWTTLRQQDWNTYRVDVKKIYNEILGGSGNNPKVHFICVLTRYTGNITTALAETNVYKWEKASGNLFFLFLLLPAIAVPVAIAAAVFLKTKGTVAKPDEELGFAGKEEFVPQEYEPEPEPDEGPAAIPMKMTTEFEPEYEAAQPQISESAMGSNGHILPHGPTYVVAGKPVNVVDNV